MRRTARGSNRTSGARLSGAEAVFDDDVHGGSVSIDHDDDDDLGVHVSDNKTNMRKLTRLLVEWKAFVKPQL